MGWICLSNHFVCDVMPACPDIDISVATSAPSVGLLGFLLYGLAIQFSDAKHIPLELQPLH